MDYRDLGEHLANLTKPHPHKRNKENKKKYRSGIWGQGKERCAPTSGCKNIFTLTHIHMDTPERNLWTFQTIKKNQKVFLALPAVYGLNLSGQDTVLLSLLNTDIRLIPLGQCH